jgi:hypothetical protein
MSMVIPIIIVMDTISIILGMEVIIGIPITMVPVGIVDIIRMGTIIDIHMS